jgi:LEA14-like dessication related protein
MRVLDIRPTFPRIRFMKRLTSLVILLVMSGSLVALAGDPVMPDLTGLSLDSTRAQLASLLGCPEPDSCPIVVLPDSFYTDSIPEGLVAWQEPLPDSVISDTVKVRLAAPLTIELPDVRGMKFMEAMALIENLGLEFYPARQIENEEYPVGTIVRTVPEPGSLVKREDLIAIITSLGVFTPIPTKTSTGIEIHLYEHPEFKISSVSVVSEDSTGFELAFKLQIRNPYKHPMTAEKFKFELQVNRARLLKDISSDASIEIPVKGVAYGKVMVPVSYADIPPSIAEFMLSEAEYRLVGTFAIVVESGFSRRAFDVKRKLDLFASNPAIKKNLEGIASSLQEFD